MVEPVPSAPGHGLDALQQPQIAIQQHLVHCNPGGDAVPAVDILEAAPVVLKPEDCC